MPTHKFEKGNQIGNRKGRPKGSVNHVPPGMKLAFKQWYEQHAGVGKIVKFIEETFNKHGQGSQQWKVALMQIAVKIEALEVQRKNLENGQQIMFVVNGLDPRRLRPQADDDDEESEPEAQA